MLEMPSDIDHRCPTVTQGTSWLATSADDSDARDYMITVTATAALGNAKAYSMLGSVDSTAPEVSFDPIDTLELGLASTFAALTTNASFASTGATTLRGDTGSTTYAFALEGDHNGTKFSIPDFDGGVDALPASQPPWVEGWPRFAYQRRSRRYGCKFDLNL
jgi:hypothetical protein